MHEAALFTAKLLEIPTAIEMWAYSGLTLHDMEAIANGTHPSLGLKLYGGTKEIL